MSLGGLYYAYKGSRLNFLDFRLLNRSKKVHDESACDKVPLVLYQVTFDVSLVTKAYCHQYDFVTNMLPTSPKII